MIELIQPYLHTFVVHFAVAFLISAPVLIFISARSETARQMGIGFVGEWMLALGIVASIGGIVTAWNPYYGELRDDRLHTAITNHRNWAIATPALFLFLCVWRVFSKTNLSNKTFSVLLLVPMVSVGVTGWTGSQLVYHYGIGVPKLPTEHLSAHNTNSTNKSVVDNSFENNETVP